MSALSVLSVYGSVVNVVIAVAATLWIYHSASASAGTVSDRRTGRASYARVGSGGSGGGSSAVVGNVKPQNSGKRSRFCSARPSFSQSRAAQNYKRASSNLREDSARLNMSAKLVHTHARTYSTFVKIKT